MINQTDFLLKLTHTHIHLIRQKKSNEFDKDWDV